MNTGGSTNTVAEQKPGCEAVNLLMNNDWKCLLRGHLVQPYLPPGPNTGLSKHGDPVFPHFWVFFGTIVFAVPIQ